jgi:HlyD family secretion protein
MANGNGKSKKKKIIIISIIVGVLVLLGVLVFLGSKREPVVSVQTEKVTRRNITQIVTATGKIQPVTQVVINAEVSGELIELPVKEGQAVRRGQLLARIKPDAYQADYDRAQGNIDMAKAAMDKAESNYKRAVGLFEKKLVSDSDMDAARADFQSAKASYAQAVASAKESFESLRKTSIYAPMDGTISNLPRELGERVSGSTFTQGTEIMTVADLAKMEARVDVGENDVVMVHVGDTARISVDSYPDKIFIGRVYQIANTATSTGTGTQDQVTNFQVRILLNQSQNAVFRPGMSMSADIETETKQNVFAVPIQSVTVRIPKKEKAEEPKEGEAHLQTAAKKDNDKLEEVVFVVKDGKATTLPVKRGISNDTYVEVTANSIEGQEIVTGPFRAINRDLESGAKVKVDNKTVTHTGASADQEKK